MIEVNFMLFDLDGTLIDSKADLARSVNLMLSELGRPTLSESLITEFVGDGVHLLVRRALAATEPEKRSPDEGLHGAALTLMRKHYGEQMLVETRLYPRVRETLDHFHQKRKAIVTSKEVLFTRAILEYLDIASDFDCIVGGDTTTRRKPDPSPLLEALRLVGGTGEKAVMIGDSENDIRAGKNAGVNTCAVAYGFRPAGRLLEASPDVMVDRIDRLIEFFC